MVIRVLIADDQQLVRSGLRGLLARATGIEVVGEAADGLAARRQVRELRPDVALLDIRMPGVDGLALTREITADPALTAVRVIVLTTYELDQYIFTAIEAGAKGFLTKTVSKDELCRAIAVVAAGEALLSPSVTERVISEFSRRPEPALAPAADRLARLTAREQQVLQLVAAGHNNSEIGRALSLSPLTAKTHVSRIMAKVGARDRAQLVALAYETGLVRPGTGPFGPLDPPGGSSLPR